MGAAFRYGLVRGRVFADVTGKMTGANAEGAHVIGDHLQVVSVAAHHANVRAFRRQI